MLLTGAPEDRPGRRLEHFERGGRQLGGRLRTGRGGALGDPRCDRGTPVFPGDFDIFPWDKPYGKNGGKQPYGKKAAKQMVIFFDPENWVIFMGCFDR